MKRLFNYILPVLALSAACTSEAPPMGENIESRDSMPVMTTYGVSKLISDSGVTRYKVITEEWRVFDKTHPQRQEFLKGIYMERYDDNQNANLHITADTAYCFDQNLWELRGRVYVDDKMKQMTYSSDVLFWDMRKHIFYADRPFIIDEPTRHVEGTWFQSDEQMKTLEVKNSSGSMPFKDKDPNDTTEQQAPPPPPPAPQPTLQQKVLQPKKLKIKSDKIKTDKINSSETKTQAPIHKPILKRESRIID